MSNLAMITPPTDHLAGEISVGFYLQLTLWWLLYRIYYRKWHFL